jgi:hypothetical protein
MFLLICEIALKFLIHLLQTPLPLILGLRPTLVLLILRPVLPGVIVMRGDRVTEEVQVMEEGQVMEEDRVTAFPVAVVVAVEAVGIADLVVGTGKNEK